MSVPLAVGIVLAALAVGSLLYVTIARRSPEGGREDRTPTNVYAVTAGAMSLLIAFTMSMAFSQYSTAQQSVQQEAGALLAMSRAATFMKPEVRDPLRDQLVCYAQAVIDDEWASMREGRVDSAPAVSRSLATMDGILAAGMDAAGPGLSMWESANVQRSNAREERLHLAGDLVPPILWLLLIFGSLITLGSLFVYADRAKPAWGHALVIIGPLFVASAALVVIAFFDHPYEATAGAVTPQPIEKMLYSISNERIGDIPLPTCPAADSAS